MAKKTPITVAHGDGIGPEIMNATLQILEAAGAALDIEAIEIGEQDRVMETRIPSSLCVTTLQPVNKEPAVG